MYDNLTTTNWRVPATSYTLHASQISGAAEVGWVGSAAAHPCSALRVRQVNAPEKETF